MNIFYIPSWYPNAENQSYGIFIKEQIEMIAAANPKWRIGISTWGRGENKNMLWVHDHIKNIPKILKHHSEESWEKHEGNIHQYYSPTLTWTRKFLNGNISGLVKTNLHHLEKFASVYGDVDVIHAQASYPAAIIAHEISKKTGIPYMVTVRMSPFPFPEFLDEDGKIVPLIKKPLEEANRLIAISHSLKAKLESHDFKNVEVIHNAVDTDFFTPVDTQSNELTLLSVGRIEPQKGYDVLLRAIAKLGNNFNGTLRIGGSGSYLEEYATLADELGIADKVVWLGMLTRQQVRSEMQACSFFVLSSRHETFGNVVAEALSCGKPVVSTRCGGPEDIVTPDLGVLCNLEDIDDLAEKLTQMINSYKTYSPQQLHQSIQDRFAKSLFIQKMESIYQSI